MEHGGAAILPGCARAGSRKLNKETGMRYVRAALLCLACSLAMALPARAEGGQTSFFDSINAVLSGFDVGIGGTVITSEYKDTRLAGSTLPLLGYEGEHLYLRGVSGGLHLYRTSWFEFNAQLSYLPQHFYADNSDDWAMRRLDDRYSSMLAGLNTRIMTPYGIVTATASTDVLGYSNGVIVDASYSYPFRLSRVALVPTVGLQWTDVNYNDYYYGVAASEARKSGFSEYTPDGCVSPYAGVTARMQFTDHVSGFASARALFLNQEITDSPMVDTSEKYSLSLGVMYKF